ncbi:MAG: glycosyltransferase [Oribacterium sp.]|nr:glycosyltransferase [Oribacterium sp.]
MGKKAAETVSIIMPAYNAGKTIKSSIESVIAQSYVEWELLIVDDSSSDDTVKVVEAIIKEHKERDIKLLKNIRNMGVAYSRNYGVKESHGEWIAFLDSDDLWSSDKLEKQVKYVKDHEMMEGLVFTGSSFITVQDKSLDYVLHVPEKIERSELLKQNVISCSSVLVSRNLVHKYRFPENIKTIHEDFVVWLGILSSVKYACGIDEALLKYRISEGSKSGKKTKAALMNWNTYRYVGLGFVQCLYYMIHYAFRGALKWARIKK